MLNKELKNLSISERIMLLEEARFFYDDLSDADENMAEVGRYKAAALETVIEWLRFYQEKILKWKEWTERTLKEWVYTIINEKYIDKMIDDNKMTEEQVDFYKGWFGLAIWIIEWNNESITWLRELQTQNDKILDYKIQNKTIADLLK